MTVKITGIDKLKQVVSSVEQAARFEVNLRGLERPFAEVLKKQNERQFATETGPDGERWPRRKIKSARPLLVDTGALRTSLTSPTVTIDSSGFNATASYSGDHAFLIKIHSEAKGTKEKGLERRGLGGVSEEARAEITEIAFRRFETGFASRLKAGRG